MQVFHVGRGSRRVPKFAPGLAVANGQLLRNLGRAESFLHERGCGESQNFRHGREPGARNVKSAGENA